MKPYRPSNGTEGMIFESKYCDSCIHNRHEEDRECQIIFLSMMFGVLDPNYPEELVYNDQNIPTCTKYSKWNWELWGDPDYSDNPNHPEPYNPNQMVLPLFDEEVESQLKK